jgi:hypothetical protein
MITPKINAPIMAELVIPRSDVKKGMPLRIVNATNKEEPVFIPKT